MSEDSQEQANGSDTEITTEVGKLNIHDETKETEDNYAEPQSDFEEHQLVDNSMVSFQNSVYLSKEMRQLVSLAEPDDKIPVGLNDVSYKSANVFPEWVLTNPVWRTVSKISDSGNEISDILSVPVAKRSGEQVSTLIHWLMSVWKIANTMGFKRCGQMLKEFKYSAFEPNENIIVEGERGLTFYLIVSGNTTVHKDGIGIVGQLSKGKSFGEIALTQGKDLRTATVTAATRVEVLSLHKQNYEYFVRDIQEAEKRENFLILTQCKLFKSWPKGKIEKMCNSCMRKIVEPGQHIFRQGDPPEDLYVIVEGSVNIVKELVIVCKNRWPVAVDQWAERTKKIHKPVVLSTMLRGAFFGEVAIIKNQPRSTSALAVTRTVLISLDKLEFLHLISYGKSNFTTSDGDEQMNIDSISKYIGDQEIMNTVGHLRGGPASTAVVGQMSRNQGEIDERFKVKIDKPIKPKQQPWRKKPAKPAPPRPAKDESLVDHVTKAVQSEALMEQIKRAANDNIEQSRRIKDRLSSLASTSTSRDVPLNIGRDESGRFSPSRQREKSGFFRSRLESARRSSISFSKAGSKRHSLAGLDNDPAAAKAAERTFNGKVLLRKNSSVRLDMLYTQFYQRLQSENLRSMDTTQGAQFLSERGYRRGTRSGSIFNNISAGGVTKSEFGHGYSSRRQSSSSTAAAAAGARRGRSGSVVPPSPKYRSALADISQQLLQEETEESDENSSVDMQTMRPFASPTKDATGTGPNSRQKSSPSAVDTKNGAENGGSRRRSAHMASSSSAPTFRLLNKPIISYRDAMEG